MYLLRVASVSAKYLKGVIYSIGLTLTAILMFLGNFMNGFRYIYEYVIYKTVLPSIYYKMNQIRTNLLAKENFLCRVVNIHI